MNPIALYKEYVTGLKEVIDEIRAHEERFQTYELKAELLINKTLVSTSMVRRKGQADRLFYLYDTATQKRVQLSEERAALLTDHFLGLGEFLAVATLIPDTEQDAFAKLATCDWEFPACAIALSYRKKGQEKTVSTKMVFIGLNDQAEAAQYESRMENVDIAVRSRPLMSPALWEWK